MEHRTIETVSCIICLVFNAIFLLFVALYLLCESKYDDYNYVADDHEGPMIVGHDERGELPGALVGAFGEASIIKWQSHMANEFDSYEPNIAINNDNTSFISSSQNYGFGPDNRSNISSVASFMTRDRRRMRTRSNNSVSEFGAPQSETTNNRLDTSGNYTNMTR